MLFQENELTVLGKDSLHGEEQSTVTTPEIWKRSKGEANYMGQQSEM